ncbi:ribonuclease H-like domain-containing protein [Tanacetum coccineum]
MGTPPRQCTAKQSASGKLNLARNDAIANVEYIFHLLKPLSQPYNSFSTLKVKGLALQEVTICALTTKASAMPWAINCLIAASVIRAEVFEVMLKNFDRDDLVKLWSLVQERNNSSGLTEDKEIELTKLSTARPKLSTDSTKIESMKLEAMVEERRIFKCWFHYHTTNDHQFTMSNRHQELAILEQTASELASPKQTALGKDISNLLIVDSLLKTIWLSMHHVIAMKHWLFQSKRLLIYSMAREDEFHDDNPPPPPPPVTPTQQAPHTLSTIKLLILNVSTDTNEVIKVLPPKTAEEMLARERERKARNTLLMALPEDHLAKFHKMTDAKDMWDAIKSRFRGNDESKKMHKYILKQQFEGFSVSNSEGLYKGYDRFQSLLSQLEIHGAGVSTEDANQKFLRVFKSDVKGSTGSSSSTQNIAFVSSESTSSTNDVSTAYGVSTPSGYNSQRENSSSYTDELMYSFFANQSSGPHLYHKDIEQLDEFDLEEMDLKWQVAMISIRLKNFYKKTGKMLQFDAKEPVGFDKTKVECFNCHNTGHFARECRSKGNQESRRRDARNTGYKAKDNGRRPGK